MREKVDKISLLISQPNRDIRLRFHVILNAERNQKEKELNKLIEFNDKLYLNIDPTFYLTLENRKGDWSMDKSIMIDDRNLFLFEKGFKNMVRHIYEVDNIFESTKSGELIISKESKTKYTESIDDYWKNQKLVLMPDVVFDSDGLSYEGVVIYFNNMNTSVDLSLHEFERLTRVFLKADLFLYSQTVLTYFNTLRGGIDIELEEKTIKKNIQKKDIFKQHIEKEGIQVTAPKYDDPKDVFNLN